MHTLAGYAYAEAVEFLQTAAQLDTPPTTEEPPGQHRRKQALQQCQRDHIDSSTTPRLEGAPPCLGSLPLSSPPSAP